MAALSTGALIEADGTPAPSQPDASLARTDRLAAMPCSGWGQDQLTPRVHFVASWQCESMER